MAAPVDRSENAPLTPERWQQVRAAYAEIAALSLTERSAYLEKMFVTDPALAREVQSLLHHEELVGSRFLGKPAVDLVDAHLDGQPTPSSTGRHVGAYEILEEIGHGGMGEVYRARRIDGQYEKEVAVKLVRSGYGSRIIVERFRAERQILASLDHPNIARLLDGGTTNDGIPYLVMELIDGTPIDQYCDENKLSIDERLNIFRRVCAAVQYAHQHLVVHRDLKPSNILVTRDSSAKLLDFGIAKIVDPSNRSETTLLHPLTPEYASPEQLRGEPITTASDVYSLGVVLYQLLAGSSPYQVTRSTAELARAITESEPEKPSVAILRRRVQNASPISADSTKWARRLQGDLDTIVLKALRKEPQHRYSSVEHLSEDIRREAEGLPVAARKKSWSYHTGKFLRRHKLGMAAAALVLVAIAGGIAATLREARIADANAANAEKRFHDVRKLANSLIFEIHDSIQALPGATPARKLLLDRAVEYLDRLSQEANGDVDLQRELAWGYQRLATVQGNTTQSNLGQVSAAEESHRKALALFETVAKANPHNLSDQLNLAMAYRLRAFFDIYVPDGRAKIDRALDFSAPLMRTDGDKLEVKDERAQEEQILAFIQDAVGERNDAIESFRRVLDLQQQILRAKPDYPKIHQGVAKTEVELGFEIGRFGPRDQALALLNTAIEDYAALVKATGDPGVIRELSTTVGRRGQMELMDGDVANASYDFRRSRELIERSARLDPENQMLQSDIMVADFFQAKALAAAGEHEKALALFQKAFQGYENLHMEDDVGPGPGPMQAWVGDAQFTIHHFLEALASYRGAAEKLAVDLGSYDDARCDLAMTQTKIANTLAQLGKLPDAAGQYEKALQTADVPFSLQHEDTPAFYAIADAHAGLGEIAVKQARAAPTAAQRADLLKQARLHFEKSLEFWRKVPYPSRISGNGFAAASSASQIASRLASLTSSASKHPETAAVPSLAND